MVFHLFYRDKDVELTCRHRDPVERWTDRRPLPVIAAVLLALGTAYGLLMYLVPTTSSPYGPYLTGLPATPLLLAEAGAQIYAALAMFKGRMSGWWVALMAKIASTALSVLNVVHNSDSTWQGLTGSVVYLLFLLWLRRYFRQPATVGARATDGTS
jgi:hypothetical protein